MLGFAAEDWQQNSSNNNGLRRTERIEPPRDQEWKPFHSNGNQLVSFGGTPSDLSNRSQRETGFHRPG